MKGYQNIMKKISNPLTIIGLFAGIAQVAGTVVLPHVNEELQNIFIWYVILFPTILVISFFLTLNLNRRVLDAPCDFEDEQNFMALQKIGQKISKLREDNPNLEKELITIQNELKKVYEREKRPFLMGDEYVKYDVLKHLKDNKGKVMSLRELVDETGHSFEAVASSLSILLLDMKVMTTIENDQQKWLYWQKHS
ncbi:MAG: hypothetical protein FWD34_06305 [Oscillospiraceae bacterium]|nr:hypothetical protein [Oscillospiraceae bacterium]